MPRTRRAVVAAVVVVAAAVVFVVSRGTDKRVAALTPVLTLEFSPTTGPFQTPAWVDITAYWMREAEVSGGQQSELGQVSPSRLSVTLDNSDRRFDPLYTAGPYYGNLKPRRPIRLTATYGPILADSAGGKWVLSVDTDGSLRTTAATGKTATGTIIISDSGSTEWAVSVGTDGALSTATTGSAQANVPVLRDTSGQNWQVSVGTDGALATATTSTAATGVQRRLFTGFVDGWPQEYEPPRLGIVKLTATDAQSILATKDIQSAYEQEVRADNPLAWWRLGEDSGTSAQDSSGNGRHGTYYGGATFNSLTGFIIGDDDTAIEFRNDGERYATLPATGGVSGSAWSIELWFQAPSAYTASAVQFTLYDQQSNDFADPDRIKRIALLPLNGALRVTAGGAIAESTAVLADDLKHHIVATWDATTLRVYVDGTLDVTATGSVSTIDPGEVALAKRTSDGVLADTTLAVLDEVATYNVTLSATRVLAHYNAGTAPWDEDSPTGRIARILDAAGVASGDRNLDTGSAVLGPFEEGKALASLQDVRDAETGRSLIYVAGDGRWTFVGRHNFWSEAAYVNSQAVFGDQTGTVDSPAPTPGGAVYPSLVESPWSGFGNAYQFDGADRLDNSSSVFCSSSGLMPTSALTYRCRFRNDDAAAVQVIMGVFLDTGALAECYCALAIITDQLYVYWVDNGGTLQNIGPSAALGGTLHEGEATFDGTNFRLFLDGTLVATSAATTLRAAPTPPQFMVGRAASATLPYSFDGVVDSVEVANTARHTAAYTPGTTPFVADANTLLLWNFDRELGYSVGGGFRLDYDDFDLVNTARIAPVTGWFQEYSSTGSIDTHGPASYEKRLIEKRPALALNTAEYLVGAYSTPVTRLDQITIQPESDPTNLYPVILAADLGYRYTVKRRPQSVGSAISLEVHLAHVTHKLTPGSWETTWRLSQSEGDVWILDVSELGSSTILGV